MDSILTSIKTLLNIAEDCEDFDDDIIMHVNSILMALPQIGVGPSEGFSIRDKAATWQDFLGEKLVLLEGVRTYLYLKVRLIFDPPTSSAVMESMTRTASELEWRLNVAGEKCNNS